MSDYGKELILDLHDCQPAEFTRASIGLFLQRLCKRIEMEPCDLHFWDDLDTPPDERETEPHLVGTSAVQFIKTSNVTIHTLDLMKRVYINIFSCKDFDADAATRFAAAYFGGTVVKCTEISRL